MRITVSHDKGRERAMKQVDESVDQIFKGMPGAPVQIVDQQKNWVGSTMHFSFTGRAGFLSAPIKGTVEVTEKDLTVDVELPGFLKSLMPEEKLRPAIESRVRGLLNSA